jgi:O-6-methylguanine DNA methyltransferase
MKPALNFSQRVWRLTAQIPRGRVSTYGLIAKALGQPRASRAVGNALNANPNAPRVPCHRVVRSTGQLGGYADGTAKKAKILRQEGLRIARKNGIYKVVNFGEIMYSGFLKKR